MFTLQGGLAPAGLPLHLHPRPAPGQVGGVVALLTCGTSKYITASHFASLAGPVCYLQHATPELQARVARGTEWAGRGRGGHGGAHNHPVQHDWDNQSLTD